MELYLQFDGLYVSAYVVRVRCIELALHIS
jgi:hypothetical protein